MGKLISLIFILVFGWGSLGWADAGAAQLSQAQVATHKLRSASVTCPVVATCGSRVDLATKACLSSLSPHISTAAAVAGGLLTLSSTMSTSDACKEKSKTLDRVNQLLALYNTACGAAIFACKTACTKAGTDATPIAGITPPVTCGATFSGDVANAMKACEGFNWNLAAGGAAIFAIIQQSNAAKQCEKDTTNVVCAPGDTRPACAQVRGGGQLDCSLAENAQKPECICQRFPNQAGCPGGGAGGGTGGVGSLQGNSAGAAAGSGFGDLNIEGGFESTVPDVRGANGTGGGGGGGNGSGGGSGADGGTAAAKPTEAAKRMNTNILGGSDGGGGGGGGRRGSSSSDDSFRSSSLGAFLPGGAKDPSRGVASGAAAAGISGAGGKSNWQKVNDRYIDNRSGFLGDGP